MLRNFVPAKTKGYGSVPQKFLDNFFSSIGSLKGAKIAIFSELGLNRLMVGFSFVYVNFIRLFISDFVFVEPLTFWLDSDKSV